MKTFTFLMMTLLLASSAGFAASEPDRVIDPKWQTVPLRAKSVQQTKQNILEGRGVERRPGPELKALTALRDTDGRLTFTHSGVSDVERQPRPDKAASPTRSLGPPQ